MGVPEGEGRYLVLGIREAAADSHIYIVVDFI
jgi:hypothetical protein